MSNENNNQPLKVVFAPGALEELENALSPEELQDLMNEIARMAETGDFASMGTPVDLDELEREEPEVYENLMRQIDAMGLEDVSVGDIALPARTLH